MRTVERLSGEIGNVMIWEVIRYSGVLGNTVLVDGKPGRQDRPARLATQIRGLSSTSSQSCQVSGCRVPGTLTADRFPFGYVNMIWPPAAFS